MRVFLLFPAMVVLLPAAVAQDMTEREALARFASSGPRVRALALRVELSRATARTEGIFPNGSLTFSREDAAGIPETYLLYQQPLSLTGRRQLLRRAAEATAESDDLAARMHLHDLRVELRLAFRELLLIQEQLDTYGPARKQLEEVVRILRAREQAGESSGYDRIRAERELSLLEAEVRGVEARLERTRGHFASFFPTGDALRDVRAVGSLALPAVPGLDLLIERSSRRADILSELQIAESSSLAMEAARRKRLPEPVVSGGLKSPAGGGRREGGYVLSLTVPLPFSDRGKEDLARADAARRAALARAEAITSEVRLRIEGAREEVQRRILASELFERQAGAQTEELVRIARVAYEAGEIGILELLDAWRTDRELGMRSLDLVAQAMRAALELERLVGEEVIP